jgi:hypothetical protein
MKVVTVVVAFVIEDDVHATKHHNLINHYNFLHALLLPS